MSLRLAPTRGSQASLSCIFGRLTTRPIASRLLLTQHISIRRATGRSCPTRHLHHPNKCSMRTLHPNAVHTTPRQGPNPTDTCNTDAQRKPTLRARARARSHICIIAHLALGISGHWHEHAHVSEHYMCTYMCTNMHM